MEIQEVANAKHDKEIMLQKEHNYWWNKVNKRTRYSRESGCHTVEYQ